MLTVTSPTDQVLRELSAEEPKAVYWLKKQFHGERGFDHMQDELIARAMEQRKDQKSDTYDYISPNGNRWMAFCYCRYYPDLHYARVSTIAFCYYETYGSVGAFMLYRWQYDPTLKHTAAVLFTDHFFLRFCQRLGIEMRSRWMVQRFIEVIPGMTIRYADNLDPQGRVKVDVRFPASIGRGIIRPDGQLMEIRTYLTDRELNRKQLRETKELREAGDNYKIEPWDVKRLRIFKSDDYGEAIEKEIDDMARMGLVDKSEASWTVIIVMWLTRALCDLDYADPNDAEFWVNFGEANRQVNADIADYWIQGREVDRDFVALFDKMFRNAGIKKYDIREFVDYLFEIARKDIDAANAASGKENKKQSK